MTPERLAEIRSDVEGVARRYTATQIHLSASEAVRARGELLAEVERLTAANELLQAERDVLRSKLADIEVIAQDHIGVEQWEGSPSGGLAYIIDVCQGAQRAGLLAEPPGWVPDALQE